MLSQVSGDGSGDGKRWMDLKHVLEVELTGHTAGLGV